MLIREIPTQVTRNSSTPTTKQALTLAPTCNGRGFGIRAAARDRFSLICASITRRVQDKFIDFFIVRVIED